MSHSRSCCQRSRATGRSTCQDCGIALQPGRVPTAQERYETSEEARCARQAQIQEARRQIEEVDLAVLEAMRQTFKPGQRFTWRELRSTRMSVCALKYALERLCERACVRVTGMVGQRCGRNRPEYELVAGGPDGVPSVAAPAAGAGTAAATSAAAPAAPDAREPAARAAHTRARATTTPRRGRTGASGARTTRPWRRQSPPPLSA